MMITTTATFEVDIDVEDYTQDIVNNLLEEVQLIFLGDYGLHIDNLDHKTKNALYKGLLEELDFSLRKQLGLKS